MKPIRTHTYYLTWKEYKKKYLYSNSNSKYNKFRDNSVLTKTHIYFTKIPKLYICDCGK